MGVRLISRRHEGIGDVRSASDGQNDGGVARHALDAILGHHPYIQINESHATLLVLAGDQPLTVVRGRDLRSTDRTRR